MTEHTEADVQNTETLAPVEGVEGEVNGDEETTVADIFKEK